jgi:hypothetical protein
MSGVNSTQCIPGYQPKYYVNFTIKALCLHDVLFFSPSSWLGMHTPCSEGVQSQHMLSVYAYELQKVTIAPFFYITPNPAHVRRHTPTFKLKPLGATMIAIPTNRDYRSSLMCRARAPGFHQKIMLCDNVPRLSLPPSVHPPHTLHKIPLLSSS